ncbi:hypothetical protein PGR6_22900 [Pseudomonas sp. GR 6-02]|nr:hypothetical protein PGR6_22900 [Pseudomonas sp. GR 6-02]
MDTIFGLTSGSPCANAPLIQSPSKPKSSRNACNVLAGVIVKGEWHPDRV